MKILNSFFLLGGFVFLKLFMASGGALWAMEERSSWQSPLWIHSLELPRELGERPIFETSTFVLSGEENEENLSLLVERRGGLVYVSRLAERSGPGLLLNRWKGNFLKNHRIRKDLRYGDLGLDIISRLEDHPRISSLELYRNKFQMFWDNPDRLEIFSSELSFPKQIIKEAIREKLPIVNQHPVTKIDAPSWEIFVGLLFISHPIDTETETPSTQYFEVPDHQLVALVGIVDPKQPKHFLLAELSFDDRRFYLRPILDDSLSEDLAQVFAIKNFDHGLSQSSLSKVSKLFKIEQIRSNTSLKEIKNPIDTRIHIYSTPKRESVLVRELFEILENAWSSKHKHFSQGISFPLSDLLSTVQDFHIGSLGLDLKSRHCRSMIRAASVSSGASWRFKR